MFKTIFKAGFKISILVSFAICVALFASKLTRPSTYLEVDNTKAKVDGFYALEENSLDVLGIGTSHLYSGLNPSVLAHYTGLSSYDFAGQCQPMEVTYNYLVEALKTQDPQLVILDIFALSEQASACQINGAYRANIQDLNFSVNKINAYKNMYDRSLLSNLFDISLYANRLDEIEYANVDDIFEKKDNYYFGYTFVYTTGDNVWDKPAPIATKAVEPYERRLLYFNKIVDLCEKEDINLLVIKTPYYITEDDANIYKYIWDICDQKGIPYIDFNYMLDELGYQYEIDGDSWHATASGAFKITKYLAEYINEHYGFEQNHAYIYEQNYQDLYFETLQVIFKFNKSFDRLMAYLNEIDCYALIRDNKNIFSEDEQIIVYNDGTMYFDRYLEVNDNSIELRYDGTVWHNGTKVYGENQEFLVVVVDKVSGQIVDIADSYRFVR